MVITPKEENTRAIFDIMFARWIKSLHESYENIEAVKKQYPEGHPERAAKLREAAMPTANCYTEDGILHPTVSNETRIGRERIADYFQHFAEKDPKGTIDEIDAIKVFYDASGKRYLEVSGKYTFSFGVDSDKNAPVVACRFTFLISAPEGGPYLWAKHTSNKLPEALPAPSPDHAVRRRLSGRVCEGNGNGCDCGNNYG